MAWWDHYDLYGLELKRQALAEREAIKAFVRRASTSKRTPLFFWEEPVRIG